MNNDEISKKNIVSSEAHIFFKLVYNQDTLRE